MLLVLWGLAPAHRAAAAPDAEAFSNGIAKATAVIAKVAPGVGSLELAMTSGTAVAEVKNSLAQSQAQTMDLGLIGSTLTADKCDGRDGTVTPDQLPQPTRVDNRAGATADGSDEVPIAGDAGGAGREAAWANGDPAAGAVATVVSSLTPVLRIDSGRAESESRVIDGAARQAHATVDVDLTLANAVTLTGLRWDAVHRTGKDPRAAATFDVGTAKLLGVALPTDSQATLEELLNTALAPSGLTVTFPTVERFTTPTDLVRITPLRIVLRDSPAGKATLGPGLNLTREQREQLFVELTKEYCDVAGALLVADIAVSVVSGTGFLAFEIGGAEAYSSDFALEDPFGDPLPPPLGDPPTPPAVPVPGAVVPEVGPAPTTPPTVPPQRAASIGPLEEHCESVHPFQSPGCSQGALAPLGLLGLAATAAVGALDWRHQRRRTGVAVAVAG